MRIEKYSKICMEYLLKNNYVHLDNKINNHIVIQNTIEKISKYDKIDIIDNNNIMIKKIHNTEYPPIQYLCYKILYKNDLYKFNDKILVESLENENIEKFIIWTNNSNCVANINLEEIMKINIKKNKEISKLYNFMFNNIEINRIDLNNLLYKNPFVSIDIQYEVETTDLLYKKYELKYGSTVSIYYYKRNIDINIINDIFNFFYEISNKKIKIKLVIFLSKSKKKIHENTIKYLCPYNINSGSTLATHFIYLWRCEEIYKVLIHELIHYFQLDFSIASNDYNKTLKYIETTFHISTNVDDRMFESYTETLANIIHSHFMAYYSKIKYGDIYNIELSFSLFQVAKILNFYGCTNIDQIFKKNNINYKKIYQLTSVLSYFIIKCSLLFNIHSFYNFIEKSIVFNERIDEYIKLIDKSIHDEKFKNTIDKYIKIIQHMNKINLKNNNLKYVCSNLRMTCFQII